MNLEGTLHGSTVASMQSQVFRREGEYWTLEFAAVVCRLRDSAGLHDLAYLLAHPNRMVPSLEIVCGRHKEIVADDAAARERARVNVTRCIAAAIKRIRQHHPLLGEHLRTTIRTGRNCSYMPDPRLPVTWKM